MPSGKVKWFNSKKGYGFITDDETKKDIFLHVSALEDSKLRVLKEEQKIVFDIKEEILTYSFFLFSKRSVFLIGSSPFFKALSIFSI